MSGRAPVGYGPSSGWESQSGNIMYVTSCTHYRAPAVLLVRFVIKGVLRCILSMSTGRRRRRDGRQRQRESSNKDTRRITREWCAVATTLLDNRLHKSCNYGDGCAGELANNRIVGSGLAWVQRISFYAYYSMIGSSAKRLAS